MARERKLDTVTTSKVLVRVPDSVSPKGKGPWKVQRLRLATQDLKLRMSQAAIRYSKSLDRLTKPCRIWGPTRP
jgi:hypothetical protein